MAEWIASEPLTALKKDDGGVRPIAVGQTIRRLIGSILLGRVASKAKELLQPRQMGVAV